MALLLLVSLTTVAAAQQCTKPQPQQGDVPWQHSAPTCKVQPGSPYIVHFSAYKPAQEWQQWLLHTLPAAVRSGYRWVQRNNKAQQYPTDFAVLNVHPGFVTTIQSTLRRHSVVKGMYADRQLTRKLFNEPSDDAQQAKHSKRTQNDRHWAAMDKPPGRWQTRPSMNKPDYSDRMYTPSVRGNLSEASDIDDGLHALRKLRFLSSPSVTSLLGADQLWQEGFSGRGVRMGVFDTGIRKDHPHVKNIRERTNWTHEDTLEDGLGHGTYVAGVVAGGDAACPGFAPEVELYTFRVFTNDQVSYTSWFLDAFNYAIASRMHIINLSIGGPDHLDRPFVDKVLEITSNGIIMVSAIGNDGPLYGTLNNPADQNDVIGVGGINFENHLATFSSRGMSTAELPRGHGRAKPDVVAFGQAVLGSRIKGGCRPLSGTSVASPVVAGAVCLLASVVPEQHRWSSLNPASMKQALVEGATRLPALNVYEQGAGKINLLASKDILTDYQPRASLLPSTLDFTDCPYMWPHCLQHIYAHRIPLIYNATVLNGMGLVGYFSGPPTFTPTNTGGHHLIVQMQHSDVLWPWSGYLAVFITVKSEAEGFDGLATGTISFTITSPPSGSQRAREVRSSTVEVPVRAKIIPTPPRSRRLLWDQYHNLQYPPAYLPRDNLNVRHDILDWHGDHPHTNFRELHDSLYKAGFHLEVLGTPFTCFNASQYGALLMVDLEEEYHPEEIRKLEKDVKELGLGLVVFADWYNMEAMGKMGFYDDNTRTWWTPATGGANIPALNDVLGSFGIAFGETILEGQLHVGPDKVYYGSGVDIVQFPAGGRLLSVILNNRTHADPNSVKAPQGSFPVLGVTAAGKGRISVFGDSNCLDSNQQHSAYCMTMLLGLLRHVVDGEDIEELLPEETIQHTSLEPQEPLPRRRADYDFAAVSKVLRQKAYCTFDPPVTSRRTVRPADDEGETDSTDSVAGTTSVQDTTREQSDTTEDVQKAFADAKAAEDPQKGPGDGKPDIAIINFAPITQPLVDVPVDAPDLEPDTDDSAPQVVFESVKGFEGADGDNDVDTDEVARNEKLALALGKALQPNGSSEGISGLLELGKTELQRQKGFWTDDAPTQGDQARRVQATQLGMSYVVAGVLSMLLLVYMLRRLRLRRNIQTASRGPGKSVLASPSRVPQHRV